MQIISPAPPADATYGYDLEKLLTVAAPAGPADFADFWQATYTAARQVPLNISKRQIASPDSQIDLYEIEFDALGLDSAMPQRIGGWLSVPADGKFERGAVVGHGYGGRDAPDLHLSRRPCVAIFPCARGFGRSASDKLPNTAAYHVLHGLASRETYLHRGCVADLWAAASVLSELFPDAADNLHYEGGSFGGGIGALMLPWDTRFKRAFLDVPSFGNHPLRVSLPCTGSGEAIRLRYRRQPQILEVLQYFDAATAARHIEIPVFVAAALSDPAVPPPGQFAVYNALPECKKLFVRQSGHPTLVEDDIKLWKHMVEWFDVGESLNSYWMLLLTAFAKILDWPDFEGFRRLKWADKVALTREIENSLPDFETYKTQDLSVYKRNVAEVIAKYRNK